MSDLRDYGGSFGGGGGTSVFTDTDTFKLTFYNTNNRKYSVYKDGASSNESYTHFRCQGLTCKIHAQATGRTVRGSLQGTNYHLKKIRIYANGEAVLDINLHMRVGNRDYNYIQFCSEDTPSQGSFWNDYEFKMDEDLVFYDVGSNASQYKFWTTITQIAPYKTTKSGYVKLEARFYYDNFSEKTNDHEEYIGYIGSVLFENFVLNSALTIDRNTAKYAYYKNETLNPNGIIVYANYYYHSDCGGGFAFASEVSNYDVTAPSMTTNNVSEYKYPTVNYSGASGSYTIIVYGYKSITFPNVKSIRNTTAFRLGETLGSSQDETAIVYGDNSSENVTTTFTIDTTKTGTYNSSASAYATKTAENVYDSKSYTVYALTSIAVTSTTHKTSYKFNEGWSTNNLVVTAHYGNNDEAGTQSVASSSTVTFPASKSVGKHSVNVSYTEQGVTKTTSYNVYVNGILDTESNPIEITLPNNGRVAKGNSLDTSAIVIKGYTYTDGTISDKGTLTFTGTGNSITFSDQDNGSTGTKTLTITMVKDGQTIVKTVNYVVYTHSEFRVNNFDDFTFYVEDAESIPTFSLANYGLSNIEVQGKDSDNDTWHTMTSNYSLSIANGATMSLGENVLTITDGISGKTVSKTITIAVGEPVSIDSYNGSIADYHERGETIDLSGITITVTLQGGIEHEVKSGFSGYLKYGEGG